MRLNKDATAYEATVNPFFVTGWSDFTFVLYDFETRLVATYQKRVWFGDTGRGEGPAIFPDYFLERPLTSFGFIGGLSIILLLLLLLFAQRREDKGS